MGAITVALTAVALVGLLGQGLLLGLALPSANNAADHIARFWRASDSASGSFADIVDLEPPLDLYSTAWALRLSRTYRLDTPPSVDVAPLENALRGVLADPGSVGSVPRLEALRRAVAALRDLSRDVPLGPVVEQLGKLRSPTGFAIDTGAPVTPVALAVALDTQVLAGIPIDNDERDLVRQSLATPASMSLQDLADTIIPTWTAADLALQPDERRAMAVNLPDALSTLWTILDASPRWDGPTLSLAAEAVEVSRANGVEVPSFDPALWAQLERDDGTLRASPESTEADLQATVAAAALGRLAPPRLLATLQQQAGSLGWQSASVSGPLASVEAGMILRKLGRDDHHQQLATFWAAKGEAMKSLITDDATLMALMPNVAMYNAMADAVGISRWMPSIPSWQTVANWNETAQCWLVRAYVLSRAKPAADVLSGLQANASRSLTSMDEALCATLVADIANSTTLRDIARAYAASLEIGGLYRRSPAAAAADLRSTAIGYAIAGESSTDVAQRFATSAGFTMSPDPGPSRTPGTLASAFYAVGLASGFDELAAIP